MNLNFQKDESLIGNEVYIRTIPSQLDKERDGKPWLAYVGQKTEDKDRTYGKQFESIEQLHLVKFPYYWDKCIHKVFNNHPDFGCVKRDDSIGNDYTNDSDERFIFNCSIEEAKLLLEKAVRIVTGTQCMPVRPQFNPYSYQKRFANKFRVCKGNRFLLAAKCRSGKTLMTYFGCKTAGYRNVLVISYFSSPIEGWINDCYKYDNGYIAIHANNTENPGWVEQLKIAEANKDNYFLITTAQFFADKHKNSNIIKS
ncbi:hypothetical protein, partial [Winogradskyella sp.]|uniref:hypothetical protein n=1 Tax=Winogradskyella sp. TaxID=1883156 RepID=UPI003F69F03C